MALSGPDAFRAVQAHCLSKDGATEEYPWGHFVWKVKGKIFAIGTEGSGWLTVKSTLEKQAMLIQHPKIEVASHVGRYGWVSIGAEDEDTLALALDLIDESYESVTAKRQKGA
jgi:predicted DNA-binding protein (MmcQ/YjbR family)